MLKHFKTLFGTDSRGVLPMMADISEVLGLNRGIIQKSEDGKMKIGGFWSPEDEIRWSKKLNSIEKQEEDGGKKRNAITGFTNWMFPRDGKGFFTRRLQWGVRKLAGNSFRKFVLGFETQKTPVEKVVVKTERHGRRGDPDFSESKSTEKSMTASPDIKDESREFMLRMAEVILSQSTLEEGYKILLQHFKDSDAQIIGFRVTDDQIEWLLRLTGLWTRIQFETGHAYGQALNATEPDKIDDLGVRAYYAIDDLRISDRKIQVRRKSINLFWLIILICAVIIGGGLVIAFGTGAL